MAGLWRSAASALQSKLDQEEAQHAADISRTTQTHAGLLVEANDRIKRLEVRQPVGDAITGNTSSRCIWRAQQQFLYPRSSNFKSMIIEIH